MYCDAGITAGRRAADVAWRPKVKQCNGNSGKGHHLQGFFGPTSYIFPDMFSDWYMITQKPFMSFSCHLHAGQSINNNGPSEVSTSSMYSVLLIFSETPSLCVGLDMLCDLCSSVVAFFVFFFVEVPSVRESGMVGDYTV